MLKQSVFDKNAATLSFAMDAVVPVNIGTTPATIALAAEIAPEGAASSMPEISPYTGPGDREFLAMCEGKLGPEMTRAARLLLEGVRARTPGDLKRGQSMNFSETPDNFWYVIVQPRVQQLSITVRGDVGHFTPVAKLPIKDDRGNTLFKVTGEADVPAALDIIFHARRKDRV
ncbi:hypothetical protein [Aminobacter sp. BE322]|uniref:hypothetical protein n=1 Tax=unclassified Aminobacter TaxID=2644704 RepID=UPI003D249996